MIRFENVTKTYKGSTVALRDCSVDIEKGEFVFLVGPSGSGKTTFIRLLLREEVPDTGRVWEAGRDITRLSKWRVPLLRRNIGCVFQDFRLLPNKTVFENVAFALEVIGRPKHVISSQVPQVLDLVGLSKKRDNLPGELSGGEQQRVAVARAFVNRPLILLADEPTGNLDPTTSLGIMKLLDRINRTGTTVVIATHDAGMVDVMRRRVIELDRGVLVRDQARGVYGLDNATAAAGAGSPTGLSADSPDPTEDAAAGAPASGADPGAEATTPSPRATISVRPQVGRRAAETGTVETRDILAGSVATDLPDDGPGGVREAVEKVLLEDDVSHASLLALGAWKKVEGSE